MILFHGSNIPIEIIDLNKSKPGKDFGKGFYLSDDEKQAMAMASFKAEQLGGEAIVSKFNFNAEGLNDAGLKIKIFEDYSLEWIDFIIANRTNTNVDNYDYVYGPIADDKVGKQLRKYFDEDIDKDELLKRLKYIKGITFQYFFGSKKALTLLTPIKE